MRGFSKIKAAGSWIASKTGYSGSIQTAINWAPIRHKMKISDSASITRGSVLKGTVTLGSDVDVRSDCLLSGDIEISRNVRIGPGSQINGTVTIGEGTNFVENIEAIGDDIIIGKYNAIARETVFQNRNHAMHKPSIQVRFYDQNFNNPLEMPSKGTLLIGNDVWCGLRSIILSGVKVGDGAIIGANSIVTKDVEPYAVVAGSPAEQIGWRFDEETREELLDISWWDWPREKIANNEDFFSSDLNDVKNISGLVE